MTTTLTPTDRAAAEIGDRAPGTYYYNPAGTFEVIAVHGPDEARILTGRTGALWAVTTRHLATGHIETHSRAWTTSDHAIPRGQQ
ncbi:hypothetical protein ACFV3R_25210 [Streptomyces sp. NPDC059740]|uniref:hypothetical protein n=1 Tax=Streptomyces sp. NPDC059740 TaxID=3346926 RepID=UPI003646E7B3